MDGLRAVAIIPVILFHAGLSAISGGYVGVDVFFVISGYLITSRIVDALEKGSFSLIDFYYARAKRILPALLTVTLVSIPFALYLMLPDGLSSFGRSVSYSLSFLANFHFLHSADYFAASSDRLPMLHTWSLAVEEQFYLLFPLLLIGLWRFGKGRVPYVLVAIVVFSFLLSIVGARNFPHKNYFMLPSRMWELLAGSLSLLYLSRQGSLGQLGSNHSRLKGGLSLLGVALIIYASLTLDSYTAYPGFATLLPVVGAVFIILFASVDGYCRRILQFKPVVWIGKLSFSLYLWHFPIFAFSKIWRDQSGVELPLWALLSLLLTCAFLTYRYIENPIRFSARPRRLIAGGIFAVTALLLGAGLLIQKETQLFKVYNGEQLKFLKLVAESEHPKLSWDRCSKTSYQKACVGGDVNAEEKVVLWGDSHAFTLFDSLSESLMLKHQKLVILTDGNCPPAINSIDLIKSQKCLAHNRTLYQEVLNDKAVRRVILAARWSWYLNRNSFDNLKGGEAGKANNFLLKYTGSEHERVDLVSALYKNTFSTLAASGLNVTIVNTVPEPGWNVPSAVLYRLKVTTLDQINLSYDKALFLNRNANFENILLGFKHNNRIKIIEPSDTLCNSIVKGRCVSLLNGVPLYADDNHLSSVGADLVVEGIMKSD